MDPKQIKAFIDQMAASDLDEMEVTHEGWTLRLSRRVAANPRSGSPAARAPLASASSAASAPAAGLQTAGLEPVAAPLFGIVHLQQAPGEPPFVAPGDVVEPGQLLCTIEAMKVFNEVRADLVGRVSAVLVQSGAEVEAGQALMTLEPVRRV